MQEIYFNLLWGRSSALYIFMTKTAGVREMPCEWSKFLIEKKN